MRINKFVIAAAIGIILIILIVVFFISKNKPGPPTPPNWTSQKTTEYTVSIPEDSQIKINTIVGGGGSSNTINLNGYGIAKPTILIQGVDSSKTSVSNVQSIFDIQPFLKTTVMVNGQNATKYTSDFPASTDNQPTNHETVVILQNKSTVYTIRLSYLGISTNMSLEATFDQFLTHLQFN